MRNGISDRFDEVEQEFLTLNKYNFEILEDCGYLPLLTPPTPLSLPLTLLYQHPSLLSQLFGTSYTILCPPPPHKRLVLHDPTLLRFDLLRLMCSRLSPSDTD